MSPKIHVIVSHFRSDAWIEIQKINLSKYANNATIHSIFEKNIPKNIPVNWVGYTYTYNFSKHKKHINDHGCRLDYVTNKIISTLKNDDILFYLDSDVVLKRPIFDIVDYLQGHDMAAPSFSHARKSKWPFSAFCAFRVLFWKEINGSWRIAKYKRYTDQGGFIAMNISKQLHRWYVIQIKTTPLHRFLFEEFADFAFHCGAGSRRPITRVERGVRRKYGEEAFIRMIKRNARIIKRIKENLLAGHEWNYGLEGEESLEDYIECLKKSSITDSSIC